MLTYALFCLKDGSHLEDTQLSWEHWGLEARGKEPHLPTPLSFSH